MPTVVTSRRIEYGERRIISCSNSQELLDEAWSVGGPIRAQRVETNPKCAKIPGWIVGQYYCQFLSHLRILEENNKYSGCSFLCLVVVHAAVIQARSI